MTTIKLAGVLFQVDNRYDHTARMCAAYRAEGAGVPIAVTDADIQRERDGGGSSDAYLESLAIYRKIAEFLIDRDVVLFHGSAVAVDGAAYLFTAKSGTGKSTHARLWRETLGGRAVMINDDKPLIGITDRGATVYGTPWDGKHHLSANISAPLKAIAILHRGAENHIERVTPKEAYPMLLQQTYRPNDAEKLRKVLRVVSVLSERTALFSLTCNTEMNAAKIAYEGMSGGTER